MSAQQHRIFVSHSHLDNDFGTKLAQDLQRVLGDESAVWYDFLGLHGGESWWQKIVEKLTACDVFILVLSPDAMRSRWVLREIDIALNEGKYILPVLYQACTIRADLKTIQVISFLSPKSYETAFKEVLIALGLPTEVVVKPKPEKVSGSPDEPGTVLLRQIERAFTEQDWPDVIRKVNYLLKRMPEAASSGVYRMQGLALAEEGQVQQAQEALEMALALVEDRQQRLTVLTDYAGLLARQGQWDEVLQRAKEALRLVPNDPGWLATQEQARRKLRGEPVATPKTVRQMRIGKQEISSLSQKTKEQWVDEGNALRQATRYQEALAAYNHAIELDPTYAPVYRDKGGVLLNLGLNQQALTTFEEALRLDPNDVYAYGRKGNALIGLRRYPEALTALEEALRLDPNDAFAYRDKGAALIGLKRNQEALTVLEEALHLDPNNVYAYSHKGGALINLGRDQEALTALEEALRFDPNDAGVYRNKGAALINLGRNQEALTVLEEALRLNPNDADAYGRKGVALINLRSYQEALIALDEALRLDPNDAFAYHNRGVALEKLDRSKEAQEAYEKARELGYEG